jgi:predicted nucleic acid-binding protein
MKVGSKVSWPTPPSSISIRKLPIHYAAIVLDLRQIGKPIPVNDLWIAVLCRQHLLPVVTRDRHFDLVPNLQRVAW